MYVLEDGDQQPDASSGPTIGAGVDLGQMSTRDLNTLVKDYGLDPALAERLKPYLEIKGKAAKDFVDENPISITSSEAAHLSDAKYSQIRDGLERNFDRAMRQAGESETFTGLPEEMRTVALSVAVQYGENLHLSTPDFWAALTGLDTQAMVDELRNFRDPHDRRRRREADYLQRTLP